MKYKTDNLGGITTPDGRELISHHQKNEEIQNLYAEAMRLSDELEAERMEPDIYDAVSQFRLRKENEELKKKLAILTEAFKQIQV